MEEPLMNQVTAPFEGMSISQDIESTIPNSPAEKKIREFLANSLKESDPLTSAVSTMAGNLLLVQSQLVEAVQSYVQREPDRLSAFAETMPFIGTALRVGNQAHQFLTLGNSLKNQATQTQSSPRRMPLQSE